MRSFVLVLAFALIGCSAAGVAVEEPDLSPTCGALGQPCCTDDMGFGRCNPPDPSAPTWILGCGLDKICGWTIP